MEAPATAPSGRSSRATTSCPTASISSSSAGPSASERPGAGGGLPMADHAMQWTRQPTGHAPGWLGRVRQNAASGVESAEIRGTPARHSVPWWGVVSSVVAPVLLVCGWTFAATVQRGSYHAVADTVSALAAYGAADRWVMTFAFLAAGVFEVATGLALRPAAAAGRLILVVGGVAGVIVAASPEPAAGG